MSKLTDLRAALEAKEEAEAALRTPAPKYKDLVLGRAWTNRRDDLHDLLADDTIRALLDVAEAAEHEPRCPFCAEERHIAGWPTQPHLADCPLAPLFPDGESGVVQDAQQDVTEQQEADDADV